MQVEFLSWRDAGWHAAARLIETHFAQVHGACITVPAIRLAVAVSRQGKVLGAAGLRDRTQGFFPQVYLDRPIADEIGARTGIEVQESDIVEVVSMACPTPLATLPLIEAITAQARHEGRSWGVFTATAPLMRLLRRTGVPLVALARARPERLADATGWGRYYQADPWVCALHDSGQGLRFMPRAASAGAGAAARASTGVSTGASTGASLT